MSTEIIWTDDTWNPTLGCDRVGEGCRGCYAISMAHRLAANPNRKIAAEYHGLTERRDGRTDWTGAVRLLPDRLDIPLHWTRPRRIFVDSMSDLFHAEVPDAFIGQVFERMGCAHWHIFQVLTKRIGRARSLLNRWQRCADGGCHCPTDGPGCTAPSDVAHGRWPLPNVHLGTSVEDDRWARVRIPLLQATPAAVRWISAEPLLGPIDVAPYLSGDCPRCGRDITTDACGTVHADMGCDPTAAGLNWIVAGGESGPGCRPMHPQWARDLRDRCAEHGVAYLFKQWGGWAPADSLREWTTGGMWIHPDGSNAVEAAAGLPFEECRARGLQLVQLRSKKRNGHLLDGREHLEYPA